MERRRRRRWLGGAFTARPGERREGQGRRAQAGAHGPSPGRTARGHTTPGPSPAAQATPGAAQERARDAGGSGTARRALRETKTSFFFGPLVEEKLCVGGRARTRENTLFSPRPRMGPLGRTPPECPVRAPASSGAPRPIRQTRTRGPSTTLVST